MNIPLSKTVQNIDRIKNIKFGVCKCCWTEDFSEERKINNCETTLKGMYNNWKIKM